MTTLISHFLNEEYLLPFWLEYHKNIFDHAILIDYGSTDDSLKIIKSITPNWEIIKTGNSYFQADLVDKEVMEIESNIDGWKICLNTTEFLLPNNNLDTVLSNKVDCYSITQYMVCDKSDSDPCDLKNFLRNLNYGSIGKGYGYRFIHKLKNNYSYGIGRHEFFGVQPTLTTDMYIAHCRFYPWNSKQIARKMSFAKMIPSHDQKLNRGYQHLWSLEELLSKREEFQRDSSLIVDQNFQKCFNRSVSIYG